MMQVLIKVTFTEFKRKIKDALETDRQKNIQDYKEFVGNALLQFAADYKSVKNKRRIIWSDWLNEITFGSDAEFFEEVTENTAGNLRNGGAAERWAFAFHYRLHAEPQALRKFARIIDHYVFGETLEGRGEEIFEFLRINQEIDTQIEEASSESLFLETQYNIPPSFPTVEPQEICYQTKREEYRRLEELLLENNESSQARTIALVGAGGYGKTAIVEEFCRSPIARESFPGGIYWLQFSLVDSERVGAEFNNFSNQIVISRMIDRQYSKDISSHFSETSFEGLMRTLNKRRLLLIADDIWGEQVSVLLKELPDHVSILATTRDQKAVQDFEMKIAVQCLPDEMSARILMSGMPELRKDQEARLFAVSNALKGWPLLLRLANGIFAESVFDHQPLDSVILEFEEFLSSDDISGWDLVGSDMDPTQRRRRLVKYCIDFGLRTFNSDAERLALNSLSIFPDDTDIPFHVVFDYWKIVFQEEEVIFSIVRARTFLRKLKRYSLLRGYDLVEESFKMHDEILSYLRSNNRRSLREFHQLVCKSIFAHCPQSWHTLPASHQYGWRYILHHLRESRQGETADRLCLEFLWLKEKLYAAGFYEVLKSFESFDGEDEIAKVGMAIIASAHALIRRPSEFGLQLIGRLGHESSSKLVGLTEAARRDGATWPTPIVPHLRPLNRSIRDVRCHDGAVEWIGFSATGESSVVASEDSTASVGPGAGSVAERVILNGHGAGIVHASFSSCGEKIITSSSDGATRLWCAQTGKELCSPLKYHQDVVVFSSFIGSDKNIISTSLDGLACFWSADNGKLLDTISIENWGRERMSVALSSDWNSVLIAEGDGTLRCLDANTLRNRWKINTGARYTPFLFASGSGKFVAAVFDFMFLSIHDLSTGKTVMSKAIQEIFQDEEYHFQLITFVDFSRDGKVLIASSEGRVSVLDIESTETVFCTERLSVRSAFVKGVFSPSGEAVVASFGGRGMALLNTLSKEQIKLNLSARQGLTVDPVFSYFGSYLLVAQNDDDLKIFDVKTGALLRAMSFDEPISFISVCEETVWLGGERGGLFLLDLSGAERIFASSKAEMM